MDYQTKGMMYLAGIGAMLAFAATANAAGAYSYVSTAGSDANPCTLALPCKTLQYAIDQAAAGGEVRILDDGQYGATAHITKTITISGNGHTVWLGSPIVINHAKAVVALRGIVFDGQNLTRDGIKIDAAAAVHIERCTIRGFVKSGVKFNRANAELYILDSIFRDNVKSGVWVDGIGVTAKLVVDGARFEHNGLDGLDVFGDVDAMITRTVADGNANHGIIDTGSARVTIAQSTAANNSLAGYYVSDSGQLTLESSEAHGNGFGLYTANSATARISNSVIVNNGYGITLNGSTVMTRRNNTVSGNTTKDVVGTLTALGST